MSCKVMYTCDHCGKEVSPYFGKQWKAGFLTVGPSIDDIHACSKEHLTLALVKAFDIPLDAATLRLVIEKNDALNAARAAIVERDELHERVAELEKRIAELTAPVTVDGKTLGQVVYEAYTSNVSWHKDAPSWSEMGNTVQVQEAWEAAAQSVLRAFGPVLAKQAVANALGRVRDRLMPTARSEHYNVNTRTIQEAIDAEIASLESPKPTSVHVHELGFCTHCDNIKQRIEAEIEPCAARSMALAIVHAAAESSEVQQSLSITIPTKPTKPFARLCAEHTGECKRCSFCEVVE